MIEASKGDAGGRVLQAEPETDGNRWRVGIARRSTGNELANIWLAPEELARWCRETLAAMAGPAGEEGSR